MLHENIKERLTKLGVKGGDFAALVGVSQPKMSTFLSGRSSFDAARTKEILTTLDDLENFKKYFPIPMAMHDPKLIAVALERLRDGIFERFLELMQDTEWYEIPEIPEDRLRLKYPKLFKCNDPEKESPE